MQRPASESSDALRVQRLMIALVFIATALNYVDRQVLALLKPTLEAEFHWTDQQFAHLGSVFQITAAASLLGVGWFVDRFGVRLSYAIAVGVWSAACMMHGVARSVSEFVVARAVLAAAESVNTPAAIKSAAVYLPLERRSRAIGIVNTAPNIGAILTPLAIPPIALAFGWQAAFLVTGALGFLWLGAWIWGTRRLKPIVAESKLQAPAARSARAALADRASWTVIGAKALTDLVWWFVLFWMPDFFNRQFGLSQGQLGVPVAIIFLLAAAGALSSGALYPALLRRGWSVNRARKSSMLLYAVAVLLMPVALTVSNPYLAAVLIGFGLFAHQGFSTNIFGMATDIVPAARIGTVIAFGGVAGNLTGSAIIELAGWSLTNGHGYAPMFVICGTAYLWALLFIHLTQPVLRLREA